MKDTLTVAALCAFALATATHAAPSSSAQHDTAQADAPIMLVQTQGMERRDDRQDNRGERRDDRQDDRGDRRDTRQDCRQEEGVVGADNRNCTQEGRQERNQDG